MIIIARKYGQLGNRLFLFAHLIAAARHYGVELRNPCFAEYADWFPSTQNDLWCRYDQHLEQSSQLHQFDTPGRNAGPSALTRTALMNAIQFSARCLEHCGGRVGKTRVIRLRSGQRCDLEGDAFRSAVESGQTLWLQGWEFRAPTWLRDHWPEIQSFFQLNPQDQSAVTRSITAARAECDVLIGVHIRRGDYATFRGGQFFYSDERYAAWMREIVQLYRGQNVGFLVCTHEPLVEHAFQGLNVMRGPGSAVQDLYALAETDWMIGPPSTFTAWAAHMGGKRRIELDSNETRIVVPECDSVAA